jgi:sulfate adenylyltransferase subunit 1
LEAFRLPVQYVNRPNLDFRGFCGTIAAGHVLPGDDIIALPSGKKSKVKAIVTYEGEQTVAFSGQAITLTLEDEIDISRGDMIVRAQDPQPHVGSAFDAHVVWMNEAPLVVGKEYIVKLGGKQCFGRVTSIQYRIDVNSLEQTSVSELKLNEIALVRFELTAPIAYDKYSECRGTGNLIVIDRLSNATVGAGMIVAPAEASAGAADLDELSRLRAFEADLNALVRKHFPHWGAKDIRDLLK